MIAIIGAAGLSFINFSIDEVINPRLRKPTKKARKERVNTMATQNSDILLSVDNLDVIYDTDNPWRRQAERYIRIASRVDVWFGW
ncbi:MAG: hypothetical protein R2683_00090 [Bifidobacterium adolescentis]